MRILYNNLLKDADTLITSSVNYNYPVANVLINSSDITYRSVAISGVTMTFDYSASLTADCVAINNHNLSSLSIEFLLASVTQATEVIDVSDDTVMAYFDSVEFDEIILTYATASTYCEIGYLSIGEYLQMPNPNAYYNEGINDTSDRYDTKYGQIYGSQGIILRSYEKMNFIIENITMYNNIVSMIRSSFNFKTLFIDINETDHTYKEPLYCTLIDKKYPTSRRDLGQVRYNFSLSFLEAK